MVDENQIEGGVKNVAGEVQDAVGGLTGDTSAQLKGKARQVAGEAQSVYGDAVEQARDAAAAVGRGVEQQPAAALLIAGVIGYVLGWLTFHRSS